VGDLTRGEEKETTAEETCADGQDDGAGVGGVCAYLFDDSDPAARTIAAEALAVLQPVAVGFPGDE
jgi:hypothetical protein